MLNIDENQMQQVIQAAFDKAKDNKRWQSAIVRAKQIIETNPYLWIQDDGTLLMLSDSNQIYELTDERCPCAAFEKGQPCKHRAVYRLLVRYSETVH